MKNLHELYMELDDKVSCVKVYDDANGTEEDFGFLSDALNWYGNREIHPLFTDMEPDENGYMEITLTAV